MLNNSTGKDRMNELLRDSDSTYNFEKKKSGIGRSITSNFVTICICVCMMIIAAIVSLGFAYALASIIAKLFFFAMNRELLLIIWAVFFVFGWATVTVNQVLKSGVVDD